VSSSLQSAILLPTKIKQALEERRPTSSAQSWMLADRDVTELTRSRDPLCFVQGD